MKNKFLASLIICTHNPRLDYLNRVLDALRAQTVSSGQWEFLIIDNASSDPETIAKTDLSWHPQARVIREERLGLTWARIRGAMESAGEIVVFLDDDNVPQPDYLENVARIFKEHPQCGVIGGKSLPDFETEPPQWLLEIGIHLGTRDLGDDILITDFKGQNIKEYPSFAPIGAGLSIRREVMLRYIDLIQSNQRRLSFGRTGKSLISGEDNDMVLTVLNMGYEVGYFPELKLTHIIPAGRLKFDYLARMSYWSSYSWIHVLDQHGIRPWKAVPRWAVPFLKVKYFILNKAFAGKANFLKWRGQCGAIKARAELR